MPEFYAVRSRGPNLDNLRIAVAGAVLLARNHACGITFVVPDRDRISRTVLAEVLGDRFVRHLQSGASSSLNGCAVRLDTLESLNPFREDGVLLVLWGDEATLDRGSECLRCKAIVALALFAGELDCWIDRHDASVLTESETLSRFLQA